uniref:E3 ubiquitin-protein ligase E3D n=1 Tax=Meloidogyne javanica TaxID=6303 RepID=A0A915LTM5_MELJA
MVVTSYIWNTFSFFIEMKPKSEFASLFISCPKYSEEVDVEPYGLIKLEEQMLELTNNLQKDSKDEQIPPSTKRMGTKFGDILLNPPTLCLISWADNQHDLLMCKVKADVDCVNLCQKSVKMLEEELSQNCNLRDYLDRIERSKTFNVVCRQCESILHTHSRNDYEFGILPCDDWLDLSPQMDYFCAFSGNECCTKHFENNKSNTKEGLLRFTGNFGSELTRHLPTENQTDILRLHLSTLHVYGDNKLKTSYIPTRFYSSECFLAWMILNKCEIYSSMKLLFRSLDKMPQILIWLIEPYVVLTRGVLKELPEDTNTSSNSFPTSISFPALKVIYKLFDSDSCHQDPRANGSDSSVGILDVPLGCCIQLAELLLNSSLSLPIPLRALGQFYYFLTFLSPHVFRMSEKSTDNKEDISPDGNEEKKKDYASETATNESSSGNSWIPGLAASWVNTAKEKTISTFEMMKKDIHEFSDTLQQGANTLAGATVKQAHHIQNLIAPVPDNVANEEQNKSEEEGTSKQSSEETNKTYKDKSGLFNFGWMKQVVDTVHKYATEDTVEDECTEELFIGTGGRKTILDQFTLLQMQNDPRTFTQAPQQNVDLYKEWLNDFKISEYNGEINLLLSNNPRL